MKFKNFEDGFETVLQYCKNKELSKSITNKIQIISEELIVNILKHAKCEEYEFSCEEVDKEIKLEFKYVADMFDPTCEVTNQQNLDLEDRRLGGLGLLMVREFTSRFTYDYRKNGSINVIKAYVEI